MSCSTPAAENAFDMRTGMADAVLREAAALLADFVATGKISAIDLRSLPMTDADRAELDQRLGHGEVSAILTVAGESEIWETAIAGVWWVRHFGEGGHVVAEEIVVTRVPEVLATHPDDAREGLRRLNAMLEGIAEPHMPAAQLFAVSEDER